MTDPSPPPSPSSALDGRVLETALRAKARIAERLRADMRAAGLTKAELARRMGTSRSALDRLLDAEDPGVTLATLASVATALGRPLDLRLQPQRRPGPREAGPGGEEG